MAVTTVSNKLLLEISFHYIFFFINSIFVCTVYAFMKTKLKDYFIFEFVRSMEPTLSCVQCLRSVTFVVQCLRSWFDT